MSENLIESVEPLLAPPVTRRPTGISESADGGVDVAVFCCDYDEGADA
ncbi:MAG: hypothetical protein ACRDLN_02795 [Solirubrobacteraceae bacterium]